MVLRQFGLFSLTLLMSNMGQMLPFTYTLHHMPTPHSKLHGGERGGSVVERQTLVREVGGSKPTSAVLCP